MSHRKKIHLALLLIIGAWLHAACADPVTTQVGGLKISVDQVFISGDTRDLDCSVFLKFGGVLASNAFAMSSVKVIRAVDENGLDLNRTNGPFYTPPVKSFQVGPPFYQRVQLKSPSSDGKPIRQIEGEVELFTPSVANGGLIILSNATAHPGQPLTHLALDTHHLSIIYQTMESFEASRTPSDKNSRVETRVAMDEMEQGLFPGILRDPEASPRKRITFVTHDAEQILVALRIQTTDGTIKVPNRGWSCFPTAFSAAHGFDFDQKPPPSLNLLVYLAEPDAIQKLHFLLENIAVPPLTPR